MNLFLLYLNISVAAFLLLYFILSSRIFYLRLGFLASSLYLFWLLPKYINARQAGIPMDEGWNSLFLFSFLSLIALAFGEHSGRVGVRYGEALNGRKQKIVFPLPTVRDRSFAVVFLTAISIGIQIGINSLPAEQLTMRQPTGLVTILRSFSIIRDLSFPLILYVFVTKRTTLAAVLLSLYVMSYAPDLLLRFKREIFFLVPIAILFAQYRFRHRIYSRSVMLILLPIAFIMLWSVAEFRKLGGYVMDENGMLTRQVPSLSALMDVNWAEVVGDRVGNNYFEAINGAESIKEISRTGDFTYGGAIVNRFVDKWVPGQIVGHAFKDSLKIDQLHVSEIEISPFEYKTGSTSTGFIDSYSDFWFFGVIVYFFNGYYVGKLWSRSRRGAITATIIYPAVVVMAILSISHSAYYIAFNIPFVWFVIFTVSKLQSVCLVSRRKTMYIKNFNPSKNTNV